MLPTHQPLTVKDLDPIGVATTLVGFAGFTVCLWCLIWLGMDKDGRLRSSFFWLAVALIICYAVMLWGLTKA